MADEKREISSIDQYIAQFPLNVRETLGELRRVIREAAPQAREKISWQMPTFDLHGNLVHFAAYKGHIGFYPGASGIESFDHELSGYKRSKGAVQFPIDQPLPYELIARIVRFRADENVAEAQRKQAQKKRGR